MRHVTAKFVSFRDNRAVISFGSDLYAEYAELPSGEVTKVGDTFDRGRLDGHVDELIGKRALAKGLKVAEEAFRELRKQTATPVAEATPAPVTEEELLQELTAEVLPAHATAFSEWLVRTHPKQSIKVRDRELISFAQDFLFSRPSLPAYEPAALAKALRKMRSEKGNATKAENARRRAERYNALTPESAQRLSQLERAPKPARAPKAPPPAQDDLFA